MGGNLSKGFSISGVLYPILILVVFVIVQMLTMLGTRKMVLDKNRNQLIDSLNNSNKVYTNEELSQLVASIQLQMQDEKKQQEEEITSIKSQLKSMKYYGIDAATNLNTMTENNNQWYAFTPDTVGRPPFCEYGIVENVSIGSSKNLESSYWQFQLVFCTRQDEIYVRKRINPTNSTINTWENWVAH